MKNKYRTKYLLCKSYINIINLVREIYPIHPIYSCIKIYELFIIQLFIDTWDYQINLLEHFNYHIDLKILDKHSDHPIPFDFVSNQVVTNCIAFTHMDHVDPMMEEKFEDESRIHCPRTNGSFDELLFSQQ